VVVPDLPFLTPELPGFFPFLVPPFQESVTGLDSQKQCHGKSTTVFQWSTSVKTRSSGRGHSFSRCLRGGHGSG
jgi:hypothetical protein